MGRGRGEGSKGRGRVSLKQASTLNRVFEAPSRLVLKFEIGLYIPIFCILFASVMTYEFISG